MADIPLINAFLIPRRSAKTLTALLVAGHAGCHRTLRCSLKQLEPLLSQLALTCNCGALSEYEPNPDCESHILSLLGPSAALMRSVDVDADKNRYTAGTQLRVASLTCPNVLEEVPVPKDLRLNRDTAEMCKGCPFVWLEVDIGTKEASLRCAVLSWLAWEVPGRYESGRTGR